MAHEHPYKEDFFKGLWEENPVFVMLLGMCPVLAVSNSVINALSMGAATFVLVLSCAIISILRAYIPKEVRIAAFILIIATFVTIVGLLIKFVSIELDKALGAFIPLIVVNCIILGRAEAFASKHSLGRTICDAFGMGLGFTFALLCLGGVRELLGSGSLLGFPVMGSSFEPWSVMILPAGGFFTLGGWLLLFNWLQERSERKTKLAEAEEDSAHG
jgi:H+/Na+-translocating ferredoxin:NAD+ oxidoreductase subunit E